MWLKASSRLKLRLKAMQTSTSARRYGIAIAGNVVRLRQDFSGQYRSEGPQFVGSIINTGGSPFYLTSDSMSFNNNGSIPLTDTGCESTCRTSVEGVGLSLNCSTYTLPFDLNPSYSSDGTYNVADDPAVINGTFVFESRFTWTLATNILSLGVAHKSTTACNGTIQVQNCIIRPGNWSLCPILTVTVEPWSEPMSIE